MDAKNPQKVQSESRLSKLATTATIVAFLLIFLPLPGVWLTFQNIAPNHQHIWNLGYSTPTLIGAILGNFTVNALFTVPGIIRGIINYRQTRQFIHLTLCILSVLMLLGYTIAGIL